MKSSSGGLGTGAIVGIVVGVVLGLLLGLAAFFVLRRRRNRPAPRSSQDSASSMTALDSSGAGLYHDRKLSEAPGSNARYEMPSQSYTAELHNKSFQAPVELPVHPDYPPTVPKSQVPPPSYSQPPSRGGY
jgi:LPXTG-motif cell wall-anchored protein